MKLLAFYKVRGKSMEPYAHEGDFVLVRCFFPGEKAHTQDVLIAPDPRNPHRLLLKRVAGVTDGGYHIRGDNESESTDSRSFGDVADIRGRVIARILR